MRVYHLRRKVTEPLRNAAKNHIPVPSDDDIIGWIEIYNQFWKNLEADKHISSNSNENFGVESSSSSEPKDFRVSGDPMELDRLQLSRVSVTPAEWQFRRDHGLCNRCGGDGHYSRNCSAEIAKRSKRAFDSADRELAAASRTEYRGSHRGGFNNNFNTPFPLRGGFSNSQNSRYPQRNNGRNFYSPRAGNST
ncbi:hypothetical protein K3495_g14769 [Podosphaera aphanis]|nr:hypothetical protein K3495_g14769 [Podosphaera aphanis]